MLKSNVKVSCNKVRGKVDPRTVRRRGERILKAVDREDAELSILLCDDPFIKKLNLKYRRFNKATDVLSFPMGEEGVQGPTPELLGDVVISVDTATRQAKEVKRKTVDEVTSLLIHGVLHLLGYDHQKAKEEKRMLSEAERLESLVIRREMSK